MHEVLSFTRQPTDGRSRDLGDAHEDDVEDSVLAWLLEGDPAIRWQVHRDLTGNAEATKADRALVEREGWGAELLARQDPHGTWAQGLYSPKWTSTTYTLLLLHRLGLRSDHPAARRGTEILIEGAAEFDGGLTLAKTIRTAETCITGMLVLLAARFRIDDARIDAAVEWLAKTQMADGGWNCQQVNGATHSSFHTSITVLEALQQRYERTADAAVADMASHGREFFIDHRLYHSHRTGEVVDRRFTQFSFPPYWHFDVLRGLDHFRAAGAAPHDALRDAVDLVQSRRRPDGRWNLQNVHRNRTWINMEQGGVPSRWNTLRSLRVLRWWDERTMAAGQVTRTGK